MATAGRASVAAAGRTRSEPGRQAQVASNPEWKHMGSKKGSRGRSSSIMNVTL